MRVEALATLVEQEALSWLPSDGARARALFAHARALLLTLPTSASRAARVEALDARLAVM